MYRLAARSTVLFWKFRHRPETEKVNQSFTKNATSRILTRATPQALTNKANGARRMHILAPSSGFFNIKFKKTVSLVFWRRSSPRASIIPILTPILKSNCHDSNSPQGKLMPGMSLIVMVEFVAHEYQHYEDFIKIHCEVSSPSILSLEPYDHMY